MVGRGHLPGRRRQARRASAEPRPRKSPAQHGLLALDWNNGNRTILVDPHAHRPDRWARRCTRRAAEIYRALIEATAFGARAIIERLREYGVPVERVVCAGGIAEKNPMLMQIYADVTGCTMQVVGLQPGLRARLGGVGGGAGRGAPGLPDRPEGNDFAQAQKLCARSPKTSDVYDALYALYRQLHDAFGGVNRSRRSFRRDERAHRISRKPRSTCNSTPVDRTQRSYPC